MYQSLLWEPNGDVLLIIGCHQKVKRVQVLPVCICNVSSIPGERSFLLSDLRPGGPDVMGDSTSLDSLILPLLIL